MKIFYLVWFSYCFRNCCICIICGFLYNCYLLFVFAVVMVACINASEIAILSNHFKRCQQFNHFTHLNINAHKFLLMRGVCLLFHPWFCFGSRTQQTTPRFKLIHKNMNNCMNQTLVQSTKKHKYTTLKRLSLYFTDI